MDKHIFVINGSGGVGKDTFVKFVSDEMNDTMKRFHTVINFSSIDKVKKIASEIGWNGRKTEKDRKFLSDLKLLASSYCDLPFKSMKDKVNEFLNDNKSIILFLHIREPEEISRAAKEFNAKTVLIIRNSIKHITTNTADKNVFNYNYDFIIENNGSLEEFKAKANEFVKNLCGKEGIML